MATSSGRGAVSGSPRAHAAGASGPPHPRAWTGRITPPRRARHPPIAGAGTPVLPSRRRNLIPTTTGPITTPLCPGTRAAALCTVSFDLAIEPG